MERKISPEAKLGPMWENLEIFEMYESGRALFRDTAKIVVGDVFQKYVSSKGKIIELGSGIGELSRLVSDEYKDRLIEIEKTERFSKAQKKENPKTKSVVADVYEMPVKDASVDTVVSFSVFDTLTDLEQAVAEVKRILKKGGRFIHLLDLQPNFPILMQELPQDMIPFPNVVNDTINGFQLVKNEDFEKVRDKIDSRRISLIDLYIKDPLFMLAYLEQNNKQDISVDIAMTINRLQELPKIVTPTLKESFAEKMLQVFKNAGFEILVADDISAETIVPANEAHKKFPGYNYFENNVGSIYKKWRPELASELPPGHVKVKSTLHTVIFEKIK